MEFLNRTAELDLLRKRLDSGQFRVSCRTISRSGFSKRIISYAASDPLVRLVTPEDIYA